MTIYALNVLGRIGKLALRPLLERNAEVAWLNDAEGDPETHAHLLEFDTVHGRWSARIAHDAEAVTVDGVRLPVHRARAVADVPLDGVDVVIDCTGAHRTAARLAPYFEAGVRRVVVSAPVKEPEAANLVMGVNHETYDPARHRIVTAASCTTNCLAPVVKVLHEGLGIRHGLDHHDPRRDQHPDPCRPTREGPAPRALGPQLADPHDHRLGHRDRG